MLSIGNVTEKFSSVELAFMLCKLAFSKGHLYVVRRRKRNNLSANQLSVPPSLLLLFIAYYILYTSRVFFHLNYFIPLKEYVVFSCLHMKELELKEDT